MRRYLLLIVVAIGLFCTPVMVYSMVQRDSISFDTLTKQLYFVTKEKSLYLGEEEAYGALAYKANILWPNVSFPQKQADVLKQLIVNTIIDITAWEEQTNVQWTSELLNSPDVLDSMLVPFLSHDEEEYVQVDSSIMTLNNLVTAYENIDSHIKHTKNGVISLEYEYYNYGLGFSGTEDSQLINFDIENARGLKLEDLIQDSWWKTFQKEFSKIVTNHFGRDYLRINQYEIRELHPQDSFDWYIADKELVFVFARYEMGSRADGRIEVGMPVKKYKKLFRPEALKYWGL